MSHQVTVPSLGESITEVVLGAWLVADGARVERDSPLVELESDKVTQELPSPAAGRLRIACQTGDTIAIGDCIASIEEVPADAAEDSPEPQVDPPAEEPSPESRIEVATETASAATELPLATPLAKKMADDMGVPLTNVDGSGPRGRITKADVLAAGDEPAADLAGPPNSPAPPDTPALVEEHPIERRGVRRERMTTIRRHIARRLVAAQREAAMLTTFNEADLSRVIELRKMHKEEFNDRHGVNLGFMSFFARACVSALRAFPAVNSYIVGDEIEYHDYVDISIAVGTDRGLVVPVIRGADRMSFAEIEVAVKDYATRARAGEVSVDEMTGGTFTITNGGVYGSMLSTPILNPPQSGIIGLHRISNRPVEDPDNPGSIVLRPMMYLALSYDHRIVDGADAVGFLVHVRQCIEAPDRLLLGL